MLNFQFFACSPSCASTKALVSWITELEKNLLGSFLFLHEHCSLLGVCYTVEHQQGLVHDDSSCVGSSSSFVATVSFLFTAASNFCTVTFSHSSIPNRWFSWLHEQFVSLGAWIITVHSCCLSVCGFCSRRYYDTFAVFGVSRACSLGRYAVMKLPQFQRSVYKYLAVFV